MKTIVLGAVLIGLLAACGGGSSTPDSGIQFPDGSTTCDLFTQSGCAAGEKCTWIRAAASPTSQVGTVGCAPESATPVAADGVCTYGAAGDTTGFDNCAKGLICLADSRVDMAEGQCRAICNLDATGSVAGACTENFACTQYINFFANGDADPVAGLCNHRCDPLTQERFDGLAACGSADPAQPTLGCYGIPPFLIRADVETEFACANVINPDFGHYHPAKDAMGKTYLNVCGPGFIIGYIVSEAQNMELACIGLCRPGETSNATPEAQALKNGVDPFQCTRLAGADANHECRYWWGFEDGALPTSPFSNTLGMCLNRLAYTYDDDGVATTPEVPWPSCADLSPIDDPGAEPDDVPAMGSTPAMPDTTPENLEWACGSLPPPMMATARKSHGVTEMNKHIRVIPLATPEQAMQSLEEYERIHGRR